MKVLELFAGTRSIGKAFEAAGHQVFSVDFNEKLDNIDLYADLEFITCDDILTKFGKPDIIWASPDCATYSIAALWRHRKAPDYMPYSDYAKKCDRVNRNLIKLINELNPKYYFIENPRGTLRKMDWMQGLPRYTITYCKYGDDRMKPTDIWTNHPNPKFIPPCRAGDSCHPRTPSGSWKNGTTARKYKDRIRIPDKLCEHIVKICEE